MDATSHPDIEGAHVIQATSGWQPIDLRELWEYRDLLYFLVLRDIKVRYAQSVLGIGWAVIQPVFFMVVFTIVFGKLAGLSSDGAPYAIFSYVALVPWTYFSSASVESTNSLIQNRNMLSKVYFPRLIMPLAPVFAKLVDLAIAFTVVFILMARYGYSPTIAMLMLPLLVLLMIVTAIGLGMWLTALAVQYRDVKYGIGLGMQFLMYASPVVYPATLIGDKYRLIYGLNPMVGVIEGFRTAFLGTNPMPWDFLAVGTVSALVLAVSGTFYFRRTERIFADVA